MISALSGNSALSLLSMFGRPQQAESATQSAPAERRPPPPPPPPSQGNGATSKSLFDALASASQGDSSSLEGLMGQLVSSLDQDGDGSLSAEEMNAAFASGTTSGGDDAKTAVSDVIKSLDTDGDGKLSAAELASGLQAMAASGPASGPPPGPPPGGGSPADMAASLVSGLDTDGDGKLSQDELAAAFGTQEASSADAATQTSGGQKSIQELLFGLLLDPKAQSDQDLTAQATSLYA